MAISIDGSGTFTGVSVGGFNSGIVNTATLADGAATQDKRTYAANEVVQVVVSEFEMSTNTMTNGTYTSVAATGLTATITPKFSNSKIIFETQITCRINDSDGHSRWQIYDNTNSRVFHNNTYCAGGHFNFPTDSYPTVHIRSLGTAVNTNAMTLEVRVVVFSGGTLNTSWSGSGNRIITLTEIKV